MSKLFFDTNALIDLSVKERPQHASVRRLLEISGALDDCVPVLLISSLKDVYYICQRHYGSESSARAIVRQLRAGAFDVVELSDQVFDQAMESDEPDLEDGIVRAAAELSGCEIIVSRDEKAFRASRCKRMDAAQAHAFLLSRENGGGLQGVDYEDINLD